MHGYPAATEATAEAAGLEENYGVYTRAAGASATTPPVHAGSMSLVPKGTAGTARATDCFLVYEQASATRPVAKISLGGNANAKTCA